MAFEIGHSKVSEVGSPATPRPLPSSDRAAGSALTAPAVGIAAAVIGAPLAVGASGPYVRLALETVLAVCLATRFARQPPAAGSILAGFVLVAVVGLQVIRLPHSWIASIAPISAAAWSAGSGGHPPAWMTVSVNPALTAAGGRRLILMLAVLAMVADLTRAAGARRFISGAIAASGIAVVAAGMAFPARGSERMLFGLVDLRGQIKWWLTPVEPTIRTCGVGELTPVNVAGFTYLADEGNVGDIRGSYIYSNHFAGAVCLTLPFVFAVWLIATQGRLPDVLRLGAVAALAAGATWLLWRGVGSRAGTVAFGLAALVFLAIVVRDRRAKWLFGLAAAGYAVGFTGFLVAVLGQIHGLVTLLPGSLQPGFGTAMADPRVRQTTVAMDMFRGSPWLGTGLNTYDDMNGFVTKGRFVSYFAHNEYAELLAETGIVGAGMALAVAVVLGRRLLRFYRSATGGSRLLGAGAWAAVAGIAAHSWFEWNLHLPANALLAAVAVGLAWSTASRSVDPAGAEAGAWPRRMRWILPLASLTVWIFLCRDAVSERTQRQLREAITADRLVTKDASRPSAVPQLVAAITGGERMAAWDPGNARLAVQLGQAHLHLAARELPAVEGGVPLQAAEWFARARMLAPASRGVPHSAAKDGRDSNPTASP